MAREIYSRVLELRQWQQEAFRVGEQIVQSGENTMLCVATPGSGKTKFALAIAHSLFKKKLIDRLEVVTPTESLKRQWSFTADKFVGIDLDPEFSNSQGVEADDYHGCVVTYALLGQDKKGIHAQNTFNKRTMVILDEVHHAGENLTWGNAVRESFKNAVFILSISGTAFRSDDNPIPFIKYDEKNMSVADYNYSYERAIKDNVCRPVYFDMFDGRMKWKVAEEQFEHTFKDSLSPDQVSKRLKTALDPKGNWIRSVLEAADKKLNEIRLSHYDAAGLVFAASQSHARELAKVVEALTGEKPPVIISDDGEGNKKIEAFKNSNTKWLISVRMVSEGVDIPRLRVGAYLTNVKAELFFRQGVGRFVRVLAHLQHQDAFVFIPQDKDIVKLAETIQQERDHALDEAKKSGFSGEGGDLFGNDYTPALKGKFTPMESFVLDSQQIAVNVGISSGAIHSVEHLKQSEDPVFVKKQRLKERLNELAKKIALKRTNGNRNVRPDFKYAHHVYIEYGGKPMNQETVEELEKREIFYRNLYRNSA